MTMDMYQIENTNSGSLSRHSPAQVRAHLVILVFIVVLLSSVYPLLAQTAHRGSADLHAALEMTGALLGLIAGFALVARFYALGSREYLLIGLAFFVNGGEDFVHGFLGFAAAHELTGMPSSSLSQFIPATYVTGRIGMGVLLLMASLRNRLFPKSRDPRRETKWVLAGVLLATAGATFVAFRISLPDLIFPGSVISRPVDLFSALVLSFALVLFVRDYCRTGDALTWWIALSIGINTVGQVLMSFSPQLFDPFFDVAHVYKVLGYAVPLLGFSLYQISVLTEHKRAEDALRESRTFLQTVIDAVPAGIFVIGADHRITLANRTARAEFGLRDLVGKGLKCHQVSHRRDKPCEGAADPCPLPQVIATKTPLTVIHTHFDEDDNESIVEISAAPICNEAGEVVQVVESCHDITNRVRAEEKLRAKSRALEEAKKEAEQANRAKSEFLANMSHELRTPMNSIIGFTNRVLKKLGDSLPARELDALQTVERNGKHLLTLINEVLDLSKIEAGRVEMQPTVFDAVTTVREVVAQVAPLAEGKPVALNIELPETPIVVEADKTKTVQIVANLLSNGIKYTDEGEVTVAVSRTGDERLGPAVRIAVRDTGVGVRPEDRPRLFQKFTQVDGSSRRRVGGTGLGLCIAQQYAQMHGGRIDVTSEFGVGSEFALLLPVDPSLKLRTPTPHFAEAARLPDSPIEGTARPDGITVLCVDDEPDVLKFLGQTFADGGYDVLLAADYDGAIEQAQTRRPDMVCLDLRMPGKNGFDVLKTLRSDPALTSIPVVVVSASDEQARALDAGARYCLAKPVDPDRLLTITRSVLAGRDRKALVVEDDRDTARFLCETLTDHGITVRTAANGKEALAQVTAWTPSVIVLDLMMPVMDGFQFLEHIQMDSVWKQIPVVILTARTLSAKEVTRLSDVSHAVLTKGHADTEQLIGAILGAAVSNPNSLEVLSV